MKKKTVSEIDINFKTVLLRADLNVTFHPGSTEISDDTRIRESLQTIQYLVKHNCKILICSHLGRPNGSIVEDLSMKHISKRLSSLLGMPVSLVPDCVGEKVTETLKSLGYGGVALLENVRFYTEEEENNPEFAQALSAPAEIYVNDAFGTSHRSHASTRKITDMLPSVAGLLMAKELQVLNTLLSFPTHPFTAILGGAKVSDKIETLKNLTELADTIIIGGGAAATFLKSAGHNIGKSPIEEAHINSAADMINNKESSIILPIDVIVADSFSSNATYRTVNVTDIPDDWIIMDIGPNTATIFKEVIRSSKTVVWNGPMGVFEWESFSKGTISIAKCIANQTKAMTVIGGGSTADIVKYLGLTNRMTHVSTGGGATLEFLAGETLPGVVGLLDQN